MVRDVELVVLTSVMIFAVAGGDVLDVLGCVDD